MNLILFAPIAAIVLMYTGFVSKNHVHIANVALACMVVLLGLNTCELLSGTVIFNFDKTGFMLQTSRFGLLMNEILLIAGLLYFLLNGRDFIKVGSHVNEYYALIFFIYAGIGIAGAYQNLLMLFLGIEIITIPLYVLTGSDRKNLKSVEAALKYFLMGAFSTALFLLGVALLYGAMGSFQLSKFNVNNTTISYNLVGGFLLILVSLAFKVSAAPFHFWTPDVYDGAPTIFTSFMATIVKVAVFVAFIKLFEGSHTILQEKWKLVIAILISLTLLIGNVTAVFQQSIKRMLAYSSIAQAGFMLFALFAMNSWSVEALVLYGAGYCLATIGLFAILSKMEDYTFDGFNGLAKSEPMLAFTGTVFLLSLAGIPLTVGFFSKYYMLAGAMQHSGKYLWLIIVALLGAAISVYYYFRLIQSFYFKAGEAQLAEPVSASFRIILLAMAVIVVITGIMPQVLLQFLYF